MDVSSYLELGDVLNPDVISDCSHDNGGFVLTASQLHLTNLSARREEDQEFSVIRMTEL